MEVRCWHELWNNQTARVNKWPQIHVYLVSKARNYLLDEGNLSVFTFTGFFPSFF